MKSLSITALERRDKEIPIDGGILRLISGQYKEHKSFQPKYQPLDYYHILLDAGNKFVIEMEEEVSYGLLTTSDARVAEEVKEKLL